jgi:ribonuclease P protein component
VLESIRQRSVFGRFRDEGRRIRHGCVWASFIPDEGGPTRVGFALGRALGSAPVRNRARRRLRAALDAHRDELPGGWLLVGAKPEIIRNTFQEIETDVSAIVSELSARA